MTGKTITTMFLGCLLFLGAPKAHAAITYYASATLNSPAQGGTVPSPVNVAGGYSVQIDSAVPFQAFHLSYYAVQEVNYGGSSHIDYHGPYNENCDDRGFWGATWQSSYSFAMGTGGHQADTYSRLNILDNNNPPNVIGGKTSTMDSHTFTVQ